MSINVTSQLSFSRLHGVFKPLGSVYYDIRLSKHDLIKILGLEIAGFLYVRAAYHGNTSEISKKQPHMTIITQ